MAGRSGVAGRRSVVPLAASIGGDDHADGGKSHAAVQGHEAEQASVNGPSAPVSRVVAMVIAGETDAAMAAANSPPASPEAEQVHESRDRGRRLRWSPPG